MIEPQKSAVQLAFPSARTVCYVEREAAAVAILAARMQGGALADAPVWSDLETFDCRPWRGTVDCVLAGFPCQPWSHAGRRAGTADERWLWPALARIIGDVGAWLVGLENVAGLLVGGGLEHVLSSLASMGFDAEWGTVPASAVGAAHQRKRIFILAHRPQPGWRQSQSAALSAGQHAAAALRCCGNPVAHPRRSTAERRGRPRETLSATGPAEGETRQRQWSGDAPGDGGEDVGHADQPRANAQPSGRGSRRAAGQSGGPVGDPDRQRPQGRGSGGRQEHHQCPPGGPDGTKLGHASGDGRAEGPEVPQGGQPQPARASKEGPALLFAPGPADDRWPDLLAHYPWLAPALEPGVCVLAAGTSLVVGESRVDQLRAAGNAVRCH